MGDIDQFLKNTQNALPHDNIKQFIEIERKTGNAIDLGCGSGRDTVFLIKNNWNVLAIDREDTREMIEKKLNKLEIERFRFSCQNFENVELEENDLVVSNYSIPFCSKNYFYEFWNKIVESISSNRILCRKLFWIK
ncbi:MAG: methyltransferase domain-containing protein [Clostridia bacterium]|nr:methyltransferase domain-containing protein [Clostridia bacterium]